MCASRYVYVCACRYVRCFCCLLLLTVLFCLYLFDPPFFVLVYSWVVMSGVYGSPNIFFFFSVPAPPPTDPNQCIASVERLVVVQPHALPSFFKFWFFILTKRPLFLSGKQGPPLLHNPPSATIPALGSLLPDTHNPHLPSMLCSATLPSVSYHT